MEERHLFLRRENNRSESVRQNSAVQFSFEFFGHAFHNTKDSPGADRFPLLAVPVRTRALTAAPSLRIEFTIRPPRFPAAPVTTIVVALRISLCSTLIGVLRLMSLLLTLPFAGSRCP